MIDTVLLNLLLAPVTNELIHNAAEIKGMRDKVTRLQAYINGKQPKEMPFNIDTRLKSYGLSLGIFTIAVGVLFAFYTWLDLHPNTAIKLAVGLLIFTYALTAITVDQYHVEIERVTKPFKKKRTSGR